jgi:uncharacterized protein YndB with AHSA1/START domain
MPATPRENSLEYELRVDARPETVFAYFTDPCRIVEWMGAEASLDPRPGGICRIAFDPTPARIDSLRPYARAVRSSGGPLGRAMSGRFVEVDPPHRVVFMWGWEAPELGVPPRSTLVEVSLEPDGDGTLLRLTHRELPAGSVDLHRLGWDHYLQRLAIAAGGGDPGADPWQRH